MVSKNDLETAVINFEFSSIAANRINHGISYIKYPVQALFYASGNMISILNVCCYCHSHVHVVIAILMFMLLLPFFRFSIKYALIRAEHASTPRLEYAMLTSTLKRRSCRIHYWTYSKLLTNLMNFSAKEKVKDRYRILLLWKGMVRKLLALHLSTSL